MAALALQRLPLEDAGADLDQLPVAVQALVQPLLLQIIHLQIILTDPTNFYGAAAPDQGSGTFWTLLDPGSGMGKKSRSGYGMNFPDHISKSVETIFALKYLNFFMQMWIRDGKKFGSGIFVLLY